MNNELEVSNSRKRIAIDDDKIEALKVEILEYAYNCNNYLNKIMEAVEATETCYKTAVGEAYRVKFQENQSSFQNIILNIENIAHGLKQAQTKFSDLKAENMARISKVEGKFID